MADLEVRKHAKQALKNITKRDNKGLWHKIKEFLLEIFIIVFAVSLSIWLHGLSEKSHQAEDVKEFLIDLKSDLAADKQEILKNKEMLLKKYEEDSPTKNIGNKIIKNEDPIFQKTTSMKEIQSQQSQITLISIFRSANSGNYEGFKSSGNIAYIRNKPLKSKILKYYEQDVKSLENSEKRYNNQLEKTMQAIIANNSKEANASNYFLTLYRQNVIEQYDKQLLEIEKISKEINEQIK
ncbi:hypothetical protein [Chryseobacterium sp. IT-36CA2]|uniref:hypothetical protein n=1 Tax=Chryseobacterium sp. IT-36CA2 TaxID=3026460 RepID=UPI0039DF4078